VIFRFSIVVAISTTKCDIFAPNGMSSIGVLGRYLKQPALPGKAPITKTKNLKKSKKNH
jgi:hypothetical protein